MNGDSGSFYAIVAMQKFRLVLWFSSMIESTKTHTRSFIRIESETKCDLISPILGYLPMLSITNKFIQQFPYFSFILFVRVNSNYVNVSFTPIHTNQKFQIKICLQILCVTHWNCETLWFDSLMMTNVANRPSGCLRQYACIAWDMAYQWN